MLHIYFTWRPPEDLNDILEHQGFNDMSHNMTDLLVLGQGSNVLFTHDFRGVIIKNEIRGIRILEENEKFAPGGSRLRRKVAEPC